VDLLQIAISNVKALLHRLLKLRKLQWRCGWVIVDGCFGLGKEIDHFLHLINSLGVPGLLGQLHLVLSQVVHRGGGVVVFTIS